jgi:hypothetical protein
MKKSSHVLIAALVGGAAVLASTSAGAFFGPFSWMRGGGWGPGWGGWGDPWWGGGYYPYWGGYSPYWGGYYPYGGGYPYWGYPYGGWGYPWWATAPVAVTQPSARAEK